MTKSSWNFYDVNLTSSKFHSLFVYVCMCVCVSISDALLVAPVEANATVLPSPNQLKRKIIIKHKKLTLTEGGEAMLDMPAPAPTNEPAEGADVASYISDLSNSIKNGYLFMQDPIDKVGVVWEWLAEWLN